MTELRPNRKISFPGRANVEVVAQLAYPYENGKYFAIFVHSLACSEEINAARTIATELGQAGISTLCINLADFNDTEASHQSFQLSDYIQDLVTTYGYLERNYEAPALLIGHSVAGVAVLTASQHMPNVAAVATIAAPADPAHISHLFGVTQAEASKDEKARLYIERAQKVSLAHQLSYLNKPYLIVHSLIDEVVDFENATDLFFAAREPKKLCPLDSSNHMITNQSDAKKIGIEIASWALPFMSGSADVSPDQPV